MDSEVIGLVSAILAISAEVMAVAGLISKRNQKHRGFYFPFLNTLHKKFYEFIFVSASWVLLVLVVVFGFNIYGAAFMDSEIKELIAWMLSLPVLILFLFSLKHLFKDNKR